MEWCKDTEFIDGRYIYYTIDYWYIAVDNNMILNTIQQQKAKTLSIMWTHKKTPIHHPWG